MKHVVVILLVFPLFVKGQNNLVPNWSFENILDCNPHNGGDLMKAVPWFSTDANSTADIFNVCDTNFFHVPDNYLGYQYPKSGNGYAGIIPFEYPGSSSITYREYAEVKLIDSLLSGKSYCVSFYVNPANNLGFSSCYINSLGAILSYDTLKPPADSLLIDSIPDISSPTIISDTVSWTKIFGIYNCLSTKKFITLGSFYNNYNTTYVCIVQNGSYYQLDDVSVVEVSNADAGNDTAMCSGETIQIGGQPTFAADYVWYELADSTNSISIDSINIAKPHISPTQTTTYVMWKRQCNVVTMDTVTVTVNCVGLKESKRRPGLLVYPNPANDYISISYANNASEAGVYDLLGKEIKRLPLENHIADLETGDLKEGVYFIRVFEKQKVVATQKIAVQH